MQNEITIVMIDDNRRDHDVFSLALNNLDIQYTCRFIKSVDQAIRLLRKAIPDYIFINISALNELGCFKRIRNITNLKSARLIAYSDIFNNSIQAEVLEKGADLCLNKTADTSELIASLKKIFLDH
ncbi:MAG: hypothetical protein ABJB05_00085 [Parafilimonas sp.]